MLSDVTVLFGEAWCVTLAPLSAEEALRRMGVDIPSALGDGILRVAERLEAGGGDRGEVLLLGRAVGGGWALVLELEGGTGWVALAPGVLRRLSRGGRTAACVRADPNQVTAHFADPCGAAGQLDAITGLRTGEVGGHLQAALVAAGFPDDSGDFSGEADGLGFARRGLLALRTATGVAVTDEMLAGPWTGGTSALV